MNEGRSPDTWSAVNGNGPWFSERGVWCEPIDALRSVHDSAQPLLLESADTGSPLGRYSFLMWDPIRTTRVPVATRDPLAELRTWLAAHRVSSEPALPPFQGGLAGLWSYDLGRSFESIPEPRWDEFGVPALCVGLYDTVMAWDHHQQRCWLVSQGLDESLVPSEQRARESLRRAALKTHTAPEPNATRDAKSPVSEDSLHGQLESLAVAHPIADAVKSVGVEVWSSFSRDGFLQAVAAGIEAIRAGDIFQVNLAHRLATRVVDSGPRLYERMRVRNAAPFAGYFDTGRETIISASPERLFKVRDSVVESRPIKGTTHRSWFPESDFAAAAELQASAKDRAENIMIVDLLRNDLSRVCQEDSMRVTQLCEVERFRYVQHLVSAIEGRLRPACDALDVVEAVFPGGSITGAPKIRAMELIAEIEPTARGAYCGSLGYIGFDGAADFSILIRTVTESRGWWTFPVGGGIVVGSSPEKEYQETWHKARGLLTALKP